MAVASARGAVPGGAVEARVGDESVGTAPVLGSRQRVRVFRRPTGRRGPITLHFPANALVGGRRRADDRHSGCGTGALAPSALGDHGALDRAGAPPLAPPPPQREGGRRPPEPAAGRPSVEMVERGPADWAWRGPCSTPTKEGRSRGRTCRSWCRRSAATVWRPKPPAIRRAFQLPAVTWSMVRGSRPAHLARHAGRAGPAGREVSINLVTRRRALLERLVEWATQRGGPWKTRSSPPRPTLRGSAARRAPGSGALGRAGRGSGVRAGRPGREERGRVSSREPRWGPEST